MFCQPNDQTGSLKITQEIKFCLSNSINSKIRKIYIINLSHSSFPALVTRSDRPAWDFFCKNKGVWTYIGVSTKYALAARFTICFHYNHNQTILILERATNSTNYVNSKQQICSSPTAVVDLGGQGSQHLFQPSWCEVCPPKPAYEKR